jgi:cytochrome b pre-mRNA-processing protein 3
MPYRVAVALTRQGARPPMMVLSLFRKNPRRAAIESLYQRTAAASREPSLYLDLGIPDTVEGRFEAVTLHMILVLRRLGGLPDPAGEVAQDLVDCFFRHLDASLRELAVGDLAVPKRMKKLGEAFTGRSLAYHRALDAGDGGDLAATLARNVLAEAEPAHRLASYVRDSAAELAAQSLDDLLREGPRFAPPPARREGDRP